MSAFDDPLAALQNQGFAPPSQPAAAPPPQVPPPTTPGGAPIPPQAGKPGTLKAMLSNFAQGFGEAATHYAGNQTAWEKQQEQTKINQRQQEIAAKVQEVQSLEQMRQFQQQIQRQQNEQQLITPSMAQQQPLLTPLIGQKFSPKDLAALQKDIIHQQLTNQGKTDVQQLKNDAAAANPRPSAAARDDRFIALSGVDPSTWTTSDQQFMKGYAKYVDVNKVQPGLERAKVLAAPRWASLDPERQAQIAVARSVAAGAFSNQLTSFNAFVGHLGDFHDAVKALGNTDITLLNKPINELARLTGQPKIQEVIAKIEPVRKEFESLLLNNRALYDADRKSADIILNTSSSPAQIEAAVKSLANTASIRLGAINSTVKRTVGADIPGILEPSNGAILQELGADIPDYGGGQQSFSDVFKSPQGPANRKAKSVPRGTPAPIPKASANDPLGIR